VHLALVVSLLLQSAAQDSSALKGARAPSFAPDGRLTVSIEGDLYVQAVRGGPWSQLTRGKAWDRDAVWTRDGAAVVYSSDRGGNFDIWRVTVNADGTTGEPEQVTKTAEAESAPTVAADGSVAFVRGFGAGARIWVRAPDGKEKRLTAREQQEIAPAYSPDGTKLAFVTLSENARRLIVRTVADSRETTANADRSPDKFAWSPAGDRIAFSSTTGRGSVIVTTPDARWTNVAVTTTRGDLAWSPDGKSLVIAEYAESTTGYNGDPDRLGDRVAAEAFAPRSDRLLFVNAPAAPDVGLTAISVSAVRDRAARNGDAYDRAWDRSTQLYFKAIDERRTQWEAVKAKHRPAALLAKNDEELERAIYAMLRERPPLRQSATGRAAVSSAHPVATAAGLEILRAGGNVVDAAAAVSFALGVVEPDASGVGGYGQMVVYLTKMEKPTLFEFMSRVPEEAGLSNTSLLVNGRYPQDGPVLANIPGTTAGMHAAFKKYGSGKVTWKDILAPAIRAAKEGYEVSEGLATTLATEREHFQKYEGSKALFFRNGQPLQVGDTIKNPDLAWVLTQIAEKGADGFYKGDVARKYSDDLHAKGNAMKMSDLARYYAPEREAVSGTYRGYTVYSSAPPVSGGADLVGKLNLLEQFEKPKLYTEDAATLNAMLSAWFLVPNGRVADPGLWPINIDGYMSKDTARTRWKCYSAERALKPSDLRTDSLGCASLRAPVVAPVVAPTSPTTARPGDSFASLSSLILSPAPLAPRTESPCGEDHALEVEYCHAAGTTAFTVADADGNAVSVTQTLGTWGGNFYVTPGLGFLSNDKLTSYGTDPNAFGARSPFARHGSTLAPTIAFKGKKAVFAVGAAGNAWITSAVYQTLIGALDFGLGPQQALELPRFLPGGRGGGGGFPAATADPSVASAGAATAGPAAAGAGGGRAGGPGGGAAGGGGRGGAPGGPTATPGYTIIIEDGFSPDVVKRLRELGYELNFVSLKGELREGYGAAVSIDGKKATAGAEPRRAGTAGAVP